MSKNDSAAGARLRRKIRLYLVASGRREADMLLAAGISRRGYNASLASASGPRAGQLQGLATALDVDIRDLVRDEHGAIFGEVQTEDPGSAIRRNVDARLTEERNREWLAHKVGMKLSRLDVALATKNPGVRLTKVLADALGCTVDDLLRGDG